MGTLSTSPATNNTQIQNNVIILTSIGPKTVNEASTLQFTLTSSDADSDSPIYTKNVTGVGTLTGDSYSYTPGYAESGVKYVNFTVDDNYGSTDTEIVAITVNNVPLTITSTTPVSNPTTTVGDTQVFEAETNRTADFKWYLNSSLVQTNTSTTIANYTNSSSSIGSWNVTLIVNDSIDTTSTTWIWDVTSEPVYSISGYVFDNINSPINSATVFNSSNTSNSNSLGYYQITGMLNGTYNFTFNKTGYTNAYSLITVNGSNLVNQNKTIYDNSSPSQVTITAGTVSINTINISWTLSIDTHLWGYQVFRNSNHLAYTTNTYYNDSGLTKNTLYQYIVRANDTYNNFGTNSSVLNITTNNTYNVSGYILNSTSVIEGANINCSCGSAASDSTGYYIIADLINATHSFTVSKTGYDNNVSSVIVSGSNLTNQNFTLTLTPAPTPTPTSAPSGGGGSTVVTPKPTTIYVDIQDKNNNPPLLNILPTLTGATIKLQNEGNASQEYIVNWNLKNALGQILDSGIESKKVSQSQIWEIPVVISTNIDGIYALEVIAHYGIYQSKTSKVFFNKSVITTEMISAIAITVMALVMSIASLYYIRSVRRKNKRF